MKRTLWEEETVQVLPMVLVIYAYVISPEHRGRTLALCILGPVIASTVLLIPQNTFQWKQAQLKQKLQGDTILLFPSWRAFSTLYCIKIGKGFVLLHPGCYSKAPQIGWFIHYRNLFQSGGQKSKIRMSI